MSRLLINIITVLFAIAVLGGCGQKGDLYLPGNKYTALVSDHHTG